MKFDDRALRCSYCGRWGVEETCRGCGAPHSPNDDPAIFRFYGKQAALANYSKRKNVFDEWSDENRKLWLQYKDSLERAGLINWRM